MPAPSDFIWPGGHRLALSIVVNVEEGAPLKGYLQQKVASFREPCTLTKVLTWLKEIIRDNLLFDERNPSMIVGDAALEAALKRKRVHVNDIRSVVVHQLVLVEAREGPWSQALLLRGMARLENMLVPPRPEEPTAALKQVLRVGMSQYNLGVDRRMVSLLMMLTAPRLSMVKQLLVQPVALSMQCLTKTVREPMR